MWLLQPLAAGEIPNHLESDNTEIRDTTEIVRISNVQGIVAVVLKYRLPESVLKEQQIVIL